MDAVPNCAEVIANVIIDAIMDVIDKNVSLRDVLYWNL